MGDDRSFIKVPTGKGIVVPFSIIAVLGSVFAGGQQLYTWYENRVAAAAKHVIEDKDVRSRLDRLERWQCRVGWNPPVTIDPNRDCSSETLRKRREE